MLDITKDIQSLTTFRRRSGDFLKQLRKSKRPVVLTVKGKAAAVVQDAEAYQNYRTSPPALMPRKVSAKGWKM
jgi:prevent-host-death family protein